MFNKKILSKLNNKKKINILVRGPSSRFFRSDKSSVNIGINVKKINKIEVDFNFKKKKLLSSSNRLKVGSVFFALHEFLFLNQKIKKEKKIFSYMVSISGNTI